MGFTFQDWFGCPECEEQEGVSTLAYKTEIVFECHKCGLVSEFVIGEDLPIQNLDVDTISERADERSSD